MHCARPAAWNRALPRVASIAQYVRERRPHLPGPGGAVLVSYAAEGRAARGPGVDVEPAPGGSTRRWSAPLLVGLVATAFVSLGIARPSLWYDEAVTISAATRSPEELRLMLGSIDMVHGVYYLFMHAWTSVFGTSAMAVRLPSAIAVGAAAAGVYLLARRWGGTRTAIIAAAVFTLLPRTTWMAIEARSTAFTVAVAVWATYLVLRALADQRSRWWWMYGALVSLGMMVNIFLALILLVHGTSLLLVRPARRVLVAWSATAGLAVLCAAPIILWSRDQSAQLGGIKLGAVQMVRSVLVNQWFLGATPTHSGDGGPAQGDPPISQLLTTPWFVASVLVAVLCWGLVALAIIPGGRRFGPQAAWVHAASPWLLPWLLLPSLAAIGYSIAVSPIYHPRYLAFCSPALAILVAAGLDRLQRRWLFVSVSVVLVALSLVVFVSQRGTHAKSGYDWAEVEQVVAHSRAEDQGVYFAPRRPTPGTALKTTRLAAIAYPAGFSGLRDVTLEVAAPDGGTLGGSSAPLAQSVDRLQGLTGLWVVRWSDYDPEAVAVEAQLLQDAGFTEQASWQGNISTVSLYVNQPR